MTSGKHRNGLLLLGVLGLIALAIPVAEVPWFSGLPLDSLPEAIALILLLPLLAVRSVRRVIGGECGRIVSRRAGRVAGVLLAIAIAAKIGLLLSGGQVGWHACYRPVDQALLAASCERSYENPTFADSATRFDERLDFGAVGNPGPSAGLSDSSWNLAFFNSLRWNRLEPEGYRERLPFEVEWTANAEADDEIEVSYVGEATIVVGDQTRVLAPSYARERTVVLRGLPNDGSSVVDFSFAPPSDAQGATPAPYARIRVAGLDPRGPTAAARILGWAVDIPLLLLLATLLLCYGVLAKGLGWHWIPSLTVALALVIPPGDSSSLAARTTLALLVVLAALLYRPSLRALLFAAFAVIGINAIGIGHEVATWGSVVYRTAGNDPLTYESFARGILETGSLQAGEDVFYYQPGIRYILFALRAVLGDGDPLLALVSRSAVSIGIVFALGAAAVFLVRQPLGRLACLAVGACVLIVLNVNLPLVDAGLSEWPTWAGIPIGVAMLILAPSRRWVLIGTAILAVCVITRTELAPALALVVAAGVVPLWRSDRRLVLGSAGLFGALLCLPLLHNLAYGGDLVLATTSGQVNVYLPLGDLPSVLTDAEIRGKLERQLRAMFYASPEASSDALLISLRLLQAAWLLGTAFILIRWRRTTGAAKALTVAPAVILAPYLVFDALPYYPRHIIAAHILMATVLALVVVPAITAAAPKRGAAPSAGLRLGSTA